MEIMFVILRLQQVLSCNHSSTNGTLQNTFFIAVERNGGVDMPIKNYTTKIDVFESLGEIQGALARNGARKIMVDYDDRGRPVGITFGLQTAQG